MNKKYITLIILLIIFFIFNLFNIDDLFLQISSFYKKELLTFIKNYYFFSVIIFIFLYTTISLIPIPGDSALGLISGMLYGKYLGTLYATISVTNAGILIFLITKKYYLNPEGNDFKFLQKLLKQYGICFLLCVRILPIIPTFITNVTLSFLNINLFKFIWTTFVGMIPILFVFSYTGQKLTKVNSIKNIFSFEIISLFTIIMFIMLSPLLYKLFKKK